MKLIVFLCIVTLFGTMGLAFGHTVDSVGPYRLEIGWMKEPVVSGETNGIELFVSPLDEGVPLKEQKFRNGISGLEKNLKVQLVYQGQKIILPLSSDHNILGKYYVFVDPTEPGFYQVNILGTIDETTVSISMHPPKVEERSYIEFPTKVTETREKIIQEHGTIQEEINSLKESIKKIEETKIVNVAYAGIGLGIAGIVVASIALTKRKN